MLQVLDQIYKVSPLAPSPSPGKCVKSVGVAAVLRRARKDMKTWSISISMKNLTNPMKPTNGTFDVRGLMFDVATILQ
jgi:hypothetical protein